MPQRSAGCRGYPHGVIAGASLFEPIGLGRRLFPNTLKVRAHDWTLGSDVEGRTAMNEYVGLDVSMKATAVSIRRDGRRIWRGTCASDPQTIASLIR